MKVLNSDDSSSISAIYQFFSFASTEYKINKTIEVDKTASATLVHGCRSRSYYLAATAVPVTSPAMALSTVMIICMILPQLPALAIIPLELVFSTHCFTERIKRLSPASFLIPSNSGELKLGLYQGSQFAYIFNSTFQAKPIGKCCKFAVNSVPLITLRPTVFLQLHV